MANRYSDGNRENRYRTNFTPIYDDEEEIVEERRGLFGRSSSRNSSSRNTSSRNASSRNASSRNTSSRNASSGNASARRTQGSSSRTASGRSTSGARTYSGSTGSRTYSGTTGSRTYSGTTGSRTYRGTRTTTSNRNSNRTSSSRNAYASGGRSASGTRTSNGTGTQRRPSQQSQTHRAAVKGRTKAVPVTTPTKGEKSGSTIQRVLSSGWIQPRQSEGNFAIVATVIILLVIGLIMVTSSSYYYAYTTMGDALYFFRRQAIWTLVGLITMLAVWFLAPLGWIRRISFAVYIASVFFCVLVLFVGTNVNGSTRWLGVGALTFQPSELAKLAVALYISVLVDDRHDEINDPGNFIMLLVLIGIPSLLVAYQNLTSGVIIAFIGLVIMFVGGTDVRRLAMVVIPVAGAVVLVIILPLLIDVEKAPSFLQGFLEEFMYRTQRIQAWIDPFSYALDEGYQTIQALYAVGSGGFFGRGLGQSIQKLGYIPEAYNDIIFAIICEEMGTFGAGLVVLLFIIFTWNGVRVCLLAPNRFTSLLSTGIVAQISLQAVMNIAVNTNSIPATGVSLPFISYGGSSMLFLMASIGLLLNISSRSAKN